MELTYDNISETLEFFKAELECFEDYLRLLDGQEESDYVNNVIKHYNIAIEALVSCQADIMVKDMIVLYDETWVSE